MRTKNEQLIKNATGQCKDELHNFDVTIWTEDDNNVALTNEKGDVALFESQAAMPGVFTGHYFFFSRGKEALEAAQSFLDEFFTDYEVNTVIGLTPTDHKGALWLNKRLGFTEHGVVYTAAGPCMFVAMNKEQWKDRQE